MIGLIFVAIAILFAAIALLVAQAFMFQRTSADKLYKADQEFYKFASVRPFTNDVYIRQLQPYKLANTRTYSEEFKYTGKLAKNGAKYSHFFKSNRIPLQKVETPDLQKNIVQLQKTN